MVFERRSRGWRRRLAACPASSSSPGVALPQPETLNPQALAQGLLCLFCDCWLVIGVELGLLMLKTSSIRLAGFSLVSYWWF